MPLAILATAHDRGDIQAAIDAATHLSRRQIERGRAPLWWDSPARYEREHHETLPGVERIQTAEELHAMGYGDCDDHAPSLAASLQVAGVPARAVVIDSPGIGYHVVVAARDELGRIRIVDPSARRGMLVGETRSRRRKKRLAKAAAALQRAAQLADTVATMHPSTAAAKALAGEALRLLDVASSERDAAASEDV
jgi:hypothetical protein